MKADELHQLVADLKLKVDEPFRIPSIRETDAPIHQKEGDASVYDGKHGFDERYERAGTYVKSRDLNALLGFGLLDLNNVVYGVPARFNRHVAELIGGYPRLAVLRNENGDAMVSRIGDNFNPPPEDGNTNAYWKRLYDGDLTVDNLYAYSQVAGLFTLHDFNESLTENASLTGYYSVGWIHEPNKRGFIWPKNYIRYGEHFRSGSSLFEAGKTTVDGTYGDKDNISFFRLLASPVFHADISTNTGAQRSLTEIFRRRFDVFSSANGSEKIEINDFGFPYSGEKLYIYAQMNNAKFTKRISFQTGNPVWFDFQFTELVQKGCVV